MKFNEAKKLKFNDRITDKETGEVVRVIRTKVVDRNRLAEFDFISLKRPTVFIETRDKLGLWHEYMHTEVRP